MTRAWVATRLPSPSGVLPTGKRVASCLPSRGLPSRCRAHRGAGPASVAVRGRARASGAAQVLVDGGRVAFDARWRKPSCCATCGRCCPRARAASSGRRSFAFGNSLRFHALVVPFGVRTTNVGDFPHYATEEEAGDSPEGRYELRLQSAAEANDQAGLDALFARRSGAQTWRLGLLILAVVVVLPVLVHLIAPPPEKPQTPISSRLATTPRPQSPNHQPPPWLPCPSIRRSWWPTVSAGSPS